MDFKNLMGMLKNEKGMALVSALMLGLIGMLMIAALLFMVDTGTWISGSKKRYQIALDATHGGLNFFSKEIIQTGLMGTPLNAMGNYGLNFTPGIPSPDFTTKLTTRGDTRDGFWPYDPTLPNTANAFNASDATFTFTFPSSPDVTVSTTILDTSRGNSSVAANQLVSGGVVNNNNGAAMPQHIPYLYQTQTQAQNSRENAILSAIYAY